MPCTRFGLSFFSQKEINKVGTTKMGEAKESNQKADKKSEQEIKKTREKEKELLQDKLDLDLLDDLDVLLDVDFVDV